MVLFLFVVLYCILYKSLASCVIMCYFSDKPSSWMTVDTALFVMSAGEIREESTLVCFTESKDKEVCLCVLRDVHVLEHLLILTFQFGSFPYMLNLSVYVLI